MSGKIVYTKTDEAPALATQSLLPIVRGFCSTAGVQVELKDISLAGRILARFPEVLTDDQKRGDDLAELARLTQDPQANIIKLPNISASVPQLKGAISELQAQGFKVPHYPESPKNKAEETIKAQYAKILGSAVNPVLREGNSDRRVAKAVKNFAASHPHSMGAWSSDSKTHVATMSEGDFFGSEKSVVIKAPDEVTIQLKTQSGEIKVLKNSISLLKDEVIDGSVMKEAHLKAFFKEQIDQAKAQGLLFSVHLKATMMKVSDPIIFGKAVEAYFAPVFEKFQKELQEVGVDSRYGLQDILKKIQTLGPSVAAQIQSEIKACYDQGPDLAMVDSDKGITNLHVPSDVIIDASMPAAIRAGGKMWNKKGQLQDIKALIPDRCYASIYQKTIEFCKEHGAFDPSSMGTVSNVGLMAKKAEEYGSHDKTFWLEEPGTLQVVNSHGETLMEHGVEKGDIWRMCQTKEVAIQDWVGLAVQRARLTGASAFFWLSSERAHDAQLIKKVKSHLEAHDTKGLDIQILSPAEATTETLKRVKKGQDSISVTGNVLRDYLTDLFPILELGTSAKMLSIVPLLAGGGLFETGAGGSAPKHVQQFVEENHLRWDSLGEFLALAASLEDLGHKTDDLKIKTLALCLDQANEKLLQQNKSPSRKQGEMDNRGSHFYLTLYWAQALAEQSQEPSLQARFQAFAQSLKEQENQIMAELNGVQGQPVDMGGYYLPDETKLEAAMRPSASFNDLLQSL